MWGVHQHSRSHGAALPCSRADNDPSQTFPVWRLSTLSYERRCSGISGVLKPSAGKCLHRGHAIRDLSYRWLWPGTAGRGAGHGTRGGRGAAGGAGARGHAAAAPARDARNPMRRRGGGRSGRTQARGREHIVTLSCYVREKHLMRAGAAFLAHIPLALSHLECLTPKTKGRSLPQARSCAKHVRHD